MRMTEILYLGERRNVKGISTSKYSAGTDSGLNENVDVSGRNSLRCSYSAKYLAKREQIEANLKSLQDTIKQQQIKLNMHLKEKQELESAVEKVRRKVCEVLI
jgi:hypothetical protein